MVNESPERCDSINNKSLTPANNSNVPIAQPKDAPAQDSEQHRDTKEASGPSVDPSDSCQSQQHPTALDRLGLLVTWTPKNCRYDSNEPPKFSLSLNLLFALVRFNSLPKRHVMNQLLTLDDEAGTITVANLYYVQPILYKIAVTFDVSFEKASSIATLQQGKSIFISLYILAHHVDPALEPSTGTQHWTTVKASRLCSTHTRRLTKQRVTLLDS